MIVPSREVAELLVTDSEDPLIIAPTPRVEDLWNCGEASIDLRLGCWFVMLKQAKLSCMRIDDDGSVGGQRFTRTHYVRFGDDFILHPRSFVLGTTLEWIRLPRNLAAFVTGKSSWGRRGLIIATATGVHPGFSGCLTLEITNLGEIPIQISPGNSICQLFIHKLSAETVCGSHSRFAVCRKPKFGRVSEDEFTRTLHDG